MAYEIRRLDYFKATVKDQPGEAYELLSQLANLGVSLLALNLVPIGTTTTQMTLFPEDSHRLMSAAAKARLTLIGPQRALLVRGDDYLGALAEIHAKLAAARVNVYASNGVTDGQGHYCYIINVRPDEFERAAAALEV
jgi:hypothetical protein